MTGKISVCEGVKFFHPSGPGLDFDSIVLIEDVQGREAFVRLGVLFGFVAYVSSGEAAQVVNIDRPSAFSPGEHDANREIASE